jgi:insecticidal toxin complex protein TccC
MSRHRHTPTLTAFEIRGNETRLISYHRAHAEDDAQARVTRQEYAPSGRVRSTWDARLGSTSSRPNQTYTYTLSGQVLRSDNVDAGYRIFRYTQDGKQRERWDTRGTRWESDYDSMSRPLSLREFVPDQAGARTTDRFTYAENDPDAAANNLCGRLTRHDDEAGSLQTLSYTLTGEPSSSTRRFNASSGMVDWPLLLTERDELLEPGVGATSHWKFSPHANLFEQTDAAGHLQRSTYTLAGQLASLALQPRGRVGQVVFHTMTYTASGQLATQTTANGIVSRNEYDPANGYLLNRKATRADGSVLQHLSYAYDPVGNVVQIEDHTQKPDHFKNQRVDGVSTYTYDSLGQLITATGREAVGALIQPGLPELQPRPGDLSQLVNYSEHYQYDPGGNLIQLRHVGQQNYTRRMHVEADSNRALPILGQDPEHALDTGFDANGNLMALENDQSLQWNRLNQLHSVVLLARASGENDTERYIYDGSGQRVRKVRGCPTLRSSPSTEVRYLPGLELRTENTEQLEVVTMQAGHCTLRYLHWAAGKPEGIDDHQLRYGLLDQVNSCSLEVDEHGKLVSHEGYYPYGGTAWWAAKSAVQARYKTRRYSGKERDATGLYYYGFRYYAPWLQRWISPDPAGEVDGLNLYRMVGNSPLSAVDTNGLMWRHVATGIGSATLAAYQLSKKDAKPADPPAAPAPTRLNTPGDAQANQWLDKSRTQTFNPQEKVVEAFSGRMAAAFNLSQGKVPGAKAIAKGAEVTAEAVQLAAHRDVSQLDKTSLAKSTIIDGYNNLGNVVQATKKAVHTTAVVATVSSEKQKEIQDELQRRGKDAANGLTTSVATGVAVSGALDTAALVAPPGPIKLALIGASYAWKVTGVIHTAEELSKIAEQHKDLISSEFGKDLNVQIKDINKQKRQELMAPYVKREP